jgi:hypothetical protein
VSSTRRPLITSPRDGELRARRLSRLIDELSDEQVPLHFDGPAGHALLDELDYARRPPTHEGLSPRFGALIVPHELDADGLGFPALLDPAADTDVDVLRRLADGRTSFVARHANGVALVCFDRTVEHESTAVHVATTAGITLVQRLPTGWVRVFAPHAVITWDGIRWWAKPIAGHLTATIARRHPELAPAVLGGLSQLCVHWLSAGRVGAILVWQTSHDAPPLHHVGLGASTTLPPLDLTQPAHFAAILNVLAQTDRAAVVTAAGRLDQIGVALRSSSAAVEQVPPYRGTRHTSALRFSYDEPSTLVFVVSSSGPVSVLQGGAVISVAANTPPTDRELRPGV